MTEYESFGVNLSQGQILKLDEARKKQYAITIKLSKSNLTGNVKLPLTKTQINSISKAASNNKGVQLKLSVAQIKHMEKNGGFLPLLALIPAIAAAVGATGGLAGGIASAVNSSKQAAEQVRHNKELETLLKQQTKEGSGVVSNVVEPIPLVGKPLSNMLKKIGLGGCVKGLKGVKWGNGLYLERQGEGLFLAREREGN